MILARSPDQNSPELETAGPLRMCASKSSLTFSDLIATKVPDINHALNRNSIASTSGTTYVNELLSA